MSERSIVWRRTVRRRDFRQIVLCVDELHDERIVAAAFHTEVRPADCGLPERNTGGSDAIECTARVGWKEIQGVPAVCRTRSSPRGRPSVELATAVMDGDADLCCLMRDLRPRSATINDG